MTSSVLDWNASSCACVALARDSDCHTGLALVWRVEPLFFTALSKLDSNVVDDFYRARKIFMWAQSPFRRTVTTAPRNFENQRKRAPPGSIMACLALPALLMHVTGSFVTRRKR